MRRLAQTLGVFLTLLAAGQPAPAGAFPMRFGGPRVHVFMGSHAFPRSFLRGAFARRPFFRSRTFGAFLVPVPIGIYGAWSPYYGYPSPYYGYPPPSYGYPASCAGPAYYPSQAAYDAAPAYAPQVQAIPPAPPAPPMPDVVEFPTGRYERRGDGVDTPYRWVWMPNPPAAPPPQSDPGDASTPPARPNPGRLFRWTDDQGVVHLTNLWQEVPPQYRRQAKHPQTS
jgi:hypothetical protein